MHYYIESGIPVGVGTSISESMLHTCTCIGHGEIDFSKMYQVSPDVYSINKVAYYYIDTANLIKDYIFVDDNKMPYSVATYNNGSMDAEYDQSSLNHSMLRALNIPLYKKMCLTAEDAKSISLKYIFNDVYGVKKHINNTFSNKENPVVIRLFLCSSKSFKASRINDLAKNEDCQSLYVNLELPQFIWVCEIYFRENYRKGLVSGEIILDATAAGNDGAYSMILINYINKIYLVENGSNARVTSIDTDDFELFNAFDSNLKKISEIDNYSKKKPKK